MIVRLLLCLTLLILSPMVVAAAPEAICDSGHAFYSSVIFCDNFEDRPADSTGWAAVNVAPKNPPWSMSDTTGIQVSTVVAKDGTKSLAFKYPACSWEDDQSDSWGCGVGYGEQSIGSSNFYTRIYLYYPGDYHHSTNGEKLYSLQGSGGRSPWAFHLHFGGSTPTQWNESSTVDYDQNVNLPATSFSLQQWYCLEIHVTSGGVLEAWIDDVKKWNYTGVSFPASWDVFFISGYWNTNNDDEASCEAAGFTWTGTACHKEAFNRYIDNVVIATARIGCLGGEPPDRGFILRSIGIVPLALTGLPGLSLIAVLVVILGLQRGLLRSRRS